MRPPPWMTGSRVWSMFGLDRTADVDGGEKGEDEGLDRDHDPDLEDVDDDAERDGDDCEGGGLEDDDQPEHDQDQHVAGEHVGEEPAGERDQSPELPDSPEQAPRP